MEPTPTMRTAAQENKIQEMVLGRYFRDLKAVARSRTVEGNRGGEAVLGDGALRSGVEGHRGVHVVRLYPLEI
eukprot:1393693-Amorphochlora_amoeboformis.AAC.1